MLHPCRQTSRPLIGERRLQRRIQRLAEEISADSAEGELVLVGLLKGSFMFIADLARRFYRLHLPLVIDFMLVSSYGAAPVSSGKVRLLRDVSVGIRGRRVLLVDDILDTGRTLDFAVRHLQRLRPAVLKTCVLLDKPARRTVACRADYVGFTIPDEFVTGYGLDHAGRCREQPFLTVL